MRKSVMLVYGTRPEAIKMLPVVSALRAADICDVLSVSTGQHREMLQQVLPIFAETNDIDLDVMTKNQTLTTLTSTVLTKMTELIEQKKPALVLVHGDTTTAMASAMACFYTRTPIGHVEAGLRSRDNRHPWPEEMNRVFIDSVADYLYAPTEGAKQNLENEASVRGQVLVTGNTGIDALFIAKGRVEARTDLEELFPFTRATRPIILVTGHRRENFGQGFENICAALRGIAQTKDVEIVYPVHLNPSVHGIVHAKLAGCSNIHLISPVNYTEMVYLMGRAYLILTDSGGIQEEGPALGKPVLVMRDLTERPEAVSAGVVRIVGTKSADIIDNVERLLENKVAYADMARNISPYGDGQASERIVQHIRELL